jgi:hypothetical protein
MIQENGKFVVLVYLSLLLMMMASILGEYLTSEAVMQFVPYLSKSWIVNLYFQALASVTY